MCEDPMKYNLLRLKPRQLSGLLHDLGADCQGKPLQLYMAQGSRAPGLIDVWLTKVQDQKLRGMISDEQLDRRYKQHRG